MLPTYVKIYNLKIEIKKVNTLIESYVESQWYENMYGEELVPEVIYCVDDISVLLHELGHVLGIIHECNSSEECAWKYYKLLGGSKYKESELKYMRKVFNYV